MFFSLLVPAFLVVVAGYVVGHGLWSWISGLVDPSTGTAAPGAEVIGWLTGAAALLGVLSIAWLRRRRRTRRRPGGQR